MGPYSSPLLNDLHTNFPDLLYHTERFNSVQSVLEYIGRVARRNTYEEARANYLRNEYASQEEERAQRVHRAYEERQPRRWTAESIIVPTVIPQNSIRVSQTQTILNDFLQTLLPQLHPSRSDTQSIEQGTLTLTAITESECAICQDTITIGQPVRMIRHCTHRFHQGCLDPWLQNHTTCPTCRYNLVDDE